MLPRVRNATLVVIIRKTENSYYKTQRQLDRHTALLVHEIFWQSDINATAAKRNEINVYRIIKKAHIEVHEIS